MSDVYAAGMRHHAVVVLIAAVVTSAGFAQRDHGPPPSALAQRCGAQIAWQPSLEAALARAKEINRPVFWYLATVPRSPMDRKLVVDMYMRAGPFSMPGVIDAINGRFVPVKEYPSREAAKARKLGPLEFIEPGFLILRPDGTEIARLDRISTFHELWFREALDVMLEGQGDLARAGEEEPIPASRTAAGLSPVLDNPGADLNHDAGLTALRQESWAHAEALLSKAAEGAARKDHVRYLLGAAQHRQNRQSDAIATWKSLIESSPESPWAAKAAAEIEGYGPFARGFEEYGNLPPDAMPKQMKTLIGTQRAREPKDVDWLVRRSVRYLLERQNADGGFTDSNYDFGGRDSLPDVYVAVTALSALALLEWESIEPERVRAAVGRASAWLSDEKNVATDNLQERVWAHAYRMLFFSRLATSGGPLAAPAAAKLRDVAKRLDALQAEDGGFAHEYPNPFATATALHAVVVADRAGVPARAEALKRGATALTASRGDDGTFAYGFGRGRGSKNLAMAGGRMPTCELALFLSGASTPERLDAAIQTSIAQHAALEQVRKYDDHAPPHGIGGFFFWYDVFGRCLAIDALPDAARKRALLDRERALIASIAEIDGRFVDSHELGKPYGTAMGLLSLKLCTEKNP